MTKSFSRKANPSLCALHPVLGFRGGGVSSTYISWGVGGIFDWPYEQTARRVEPGALGVCLIVSISLPLDATLIHISFCFCKHSQHPPTCTTCSSLFSLPNGRRCCPKCVLRGALDGVLCEMCSLFIANWQFQRFNSVMNVSF